MSAITIKSPLMQTNTGFRPPVTPSQAGEVIAVRTQVAVGTTLPINSILQMVPLPPECVPVDVILDVTDLDSNVTKTATFSVGILNEDEDDLVSTKLFISQADTPQAGGVKRADQVNGFRVARHATLPQTIAIKVHAAAATAKAGTVGLTVLYRAASFGV